MSVTGVDRLACTQFVLLIRLLGYPLPRRSRMSFDSDMRIAHSSMRLAQKSALKSVVKMAAQGTTSITACFADHITLK